MLKGFYRDGDIVVDLHGYDLSDTFTFYLSCPLTATRNLIDRGIRIESEDESVYYPPRWEDLYLSVGPSCISVSMFTEEDGGKTYKNDIDAKFFQKLGSLIRGMKLSCYNSNRDDYLDLLGNKGSFLTNKVVKYTIPVKSELEKGTVELSMCSVVSMRVGDETTDVQLVLEEDYSYALKVNKITSRHHKVKLDLSDFIPKEFKFDSDGWNNNIEDDIYSISEIIEMNPHKNYLWIKDRKYHVVNNIDDIEKICKEIWKHKGIVSFDTETTGLNITFKSRQGFGDRLVGMVFSIREGESWYFPVAHKKIKNICTADNEYYIIEKYFKPILEEKDILCHNGIFDWKVMHIYNIFTNIVHDTLILYRLSLWNDNRGLKLGLKDLTSVLLNRDSIELSDFVKGKWGSNDVKFWDLPFKSVKYYACPDSDNTLALYNFAVRENLFDKYGMRKVYEIEVGFSIVIAYQEFYGHCADVTRTEELAKKIEDITNEEYANMVKIVGHDFNPNSTKDLPKVMYEELGYPSIFKTDTGNASTGKKALKWLMDKTDVDGNPLYPLAHHLKKYKDNKQLKSNFIDVMGKWATEDGFMFTEVNQFLETGRVSVKNPNYQSYNDTVKKYIIPREGFYMMDSDYSSVEYRILASMAGQENLIESFKDPDTDYHSYQASRMFGVPYELVTKQLRSQAKGVNFGLPYGMADPSLGEHIFGTRSAENTLKAKRLRKLYFEGQEKIEQFFIEARANGVANSFSETFYGRRRYFDKRKKDKASIEREAGNNRIQGTAADIYKIAMVRLLTTIRKNGWMGKVLISAFVHDECVLEVHKSIDPAIMLATLQECLMLKNQGWCPLFIGAGYGTNWYDAKKTEIPVQVQDKIVKTWGTTGLDWWDGDTEKLFDWEVGLINDYKRDRVIDYLKDENNWNKVIKPVENGFAHEVLDELTAGRHVDGVVDSNVSSKKGTIDNLREFCKAFGVLDLFDKANILEPVMAETSNSLDFSDGADEEEEKVDLKAIILTKVSSLGVGLDNANKKVYIRYDEHDKGLMTAVKSIINRFPGSYEVYAVMGDNDIYTTGLSMDLKGYRDLMSAYMTRRNMLRR